MAAGVIVGVDVGMARVGVARCDPDRHLAFPVTTLKRDPWGGHVDEIAEIVREHDATVVVVGLPLHLGGHAGEAATMAISFARDLAELIDVPIRLVDERLTSRSAHRALQAAGRPLRDHRAVVDQQAAVIMVEQSLDTLARSGALPGRDVKEFVTAHEEANW